MIEFHKSELDDKCFLTKIESLTNELVKDLVPEEVFVIKVDNWFDKKWLNFTGKVLGALGTWNYDSEARIPPFSTNRIIKTTHYKVDKLGNYFQTNQKKEIHQKQSAEKNSNNRIVNISDSAIFIWFSSNTLKNEHGSLMVYSIQNNDCQSFYVGLKQLNNWKITSCLGINKKVIEFYLSRNETAFS